MGGIVVTTPFKELFDQFPEEPTPEEKLVYPDFRVRVVVIRQRPPRHPYFEYTRNIGIANIEDVFKGTDMNISESGKIHFTFPERWMSMHEQQMFMYKLSRHKDIGKVKLVDIITSSALIIGDFVKEQIRIITFNDDGEYTYNG